MLIYLECKNLTYAATTLYWNVEPEINDIISHYGYIIQISEGELGPWTDLYTDPIYAFGFVDTVTQRGMIDQRIYYRVKAVDIDSNTVFYSNNICLFNESDNFISDYISEQEILYLKRFGQECLHFARRKFGDRCPLCYDKVQKKSTRPKCPVCFGTTFTGGYFAPVKIYINTDQQPILIDKTDYGVNEGVSLSAWTSNEVLIAADDILAFLKKPSQRYKIDRIVPTSISSNTVRQILNMTQLRADNPAQLLPIDISAYTLDEFNIFRRDWRISCGL
jgi:hypothetical protein